jgi:hypothetical protein
MLFILLSSDGNSNTVQAFMNYFVMALEPRDRLRCYETLMEGYLDAKRNSQRGQTNALDGSHPASMRRGRM